MESKFHISRLPSPATMMRGPNMIKLFCQNCEQEKTHGFKFFAMGGMHPLNGSFFVCDDCLKDAKKK